MPLTGTNRKRRKRLVPGAGGKMGWRPEGGRAEVTAGQGGLGDGAPQSSQGGQGLLGTAAQSPAGLPHSRHSVKHTVTSPKSPLSVSEAD